MKLFITRHGQAEDNVNGITMGQRDSALTTIGIRQTQSKALQLGQSSQKIDCIYTSDLGRCTQTAQIIAKALDLPEATTDERLREISFGEYEGLPYSAIPHLEGGYMKVQFPHGESNEVMAIRVIDAINRIYETNKEACVLIISHSGPIAAILASYYGKDLQTMLDDKIGNEEIVTLQVDNELTYPDIVRGGIDSMERQHIAEFDYDRHEIERALFFLSNALQDSGHNTKPVLLHSIQVAEMLWERDLSQDAVIAAVLHDVVEDTAITIEDVKQHFGEQVAQYVDALTISDTQDAMQSFARTAELGSEALSIRAVDLIQNSYYYHLAPTRIQKTLKAKFKRFLDNYIEKIDPSLQNELQNAYYENVVDLSD